MDFNKYQEQASKTAVYPGRDSNLLYTVLGLSGETGELAHKLLQIYTPMMVDYTANVEVNLFNALIDFVEVSERLEKMKKEIRDTDSLGGKKLVSIAKDIQSNITPESHDGMCKELGDIGWYCSQVAHELGVKSADVAQWNLNKLKSRQERNKLHGTGDDR